MKVEHARRAISLATLGAVAALATSGAGPSEKVEGPAVSERAARVHAAGMLVDGHNDLPWKLRQLGDVGFAKYDISKRIEGTQTDIPRLRAGGVKAQFWSVFIPSNTSNPARTVTEQIDLVHRMVERYPDDLEMAYSADDIERIAKAGKVASLIGIEGGVAIEEDLAQLRSFYRLGARYMTLTHGKTLSWADSATDQHRHDGLTPFGERVVREMNRLGMLVDISHVAHETMADVLRVSKAPIIASHSSAYAICPRLRNVPDAMLMEVARNRGVVMVNFFSGFIVAEYGRQVDEARRMLLAKYKDDDDGYWKALDTWYDAHKPPRGTVADVADHIDHIVKVAGIDHVGIGSDFDGIAVWPVGLEDVSCFPRLTEELLRRGYSEADVHKVLGGNLLRAFREAAALAAVLRKTTRPDVDPKE
ncbi:MAG TPA: dipeptidase [Isosphaeraceae bacterium]|jgi:membrane dipeptidase|nr:dipeptidase [Isosphaeraceae bacterium]